MDVESGKTCFLFPDFYIAGHTSFKLTKQVKTYLQNKSKNRAFSKDRPFTVPGLLMTHHEIVVHLNFS